MLRWLMWLRVWWLTKSDNECAEAGIPRHLHQGSKPALHLFGRREKLFRRFPRGYFHDIAHTVSFKRKNSSVTRSLFSTANDARWDVATGIYRDEHGVVSFPAHVLSDATCFSDDGQTSVRITLFHDPQRCNYAHCDFHFFQNDVEVQEIKTPSLKLKVRDMLRPMIKTEL